MKTSFTLLCLLTASAARAAFAIDVVYDTSATVREQQTVARAVGFWESRITGYTYDHGISGLTLYVSAGSYSNAAGGYVWQTNGVQGSVYVAESGVLEIDSDDALAMDATTFDNAVTRALGFALGFGMYGTPDSLWNVNGLTSSATVYTGAYATTAAGSSSLGLATVPGTSVKGWNQSGLANDLFAASPTNLSQATLGAVSLAAMRDVGYTVVPEVQATPFVAGAATLALLVGRRRKPVRIASV